MVFINPWAFYHPDDIPDLTPRDDEEMVTVISEREMLLNSLYKDLKKLREE